MKIFARGMKWTGLLIMGALLIIGATQSDKIKVFLEKIPFIGDIVNK